MRLLYYIIILLNFQSLDAAVKIAILGDSIAKGHLHETAFSNYPDPDNGIQTYDPMYYLLATASGYLTGTNVGSGSSTWLNVAVDGLADSKTQYQWAGAWTPKYYWFHCGVNDISIYGANAWSESVTNINYLYTAIVSIGGIMLIDEVLPWTNGDDTQAGYVRSFNTSLASWASGKSKVYIISMHDAMGQVRVSTGQLDDLNTSYNHDGVHPNEVGVQAMTAIVWSTIQNIENALPPFRNRFRGVNQ